MTHLRIGISGWTYPPWRGVFYPEKWPQKRELEYASRQVNSIEINGTFYSLQKPESFEAWREATPEDFVFSVKCPQFITHIRRLKNAEGPLANFYASGVLRLGEKLGPMLWQLPPNFKFDAEILEEFLKQLPHDAKEAAALGRKHEPRMKGRTWLAVKDNHPIRHAMEIRHKSFETPEFITMLQKYSVAIVVADTGGKWPQIEDLTSDFVYLRLHGPEELYASGYTEEALDEWARKIRAWSRGTTPKDSKLIGKRSDIKKVKRDVYVYFDNDLKVRAPFDARMLAEKLAKVNKSM
jgi:uncharacterized protein YecE (DUF72 family)